MARIVKNKRNFKNKETKKLRRIRENQVKTDRNKN